MKRDKQIYAYPLYYEIGFCWDRISRPVDFMLRCYGEHCGGRDPRSILDNGCGTGRYLEKFAKAGLRVCGYDLSPEMVEYAAAKLSKVTRQSRVFEADLRNFSTPRRYDMAISTDGSFQHLYTVEDVTRHLRCVSRTLKRRGLYIVPLPAPERLIEQPPGSVPSQWSRSRGGISMTIHFTHRQHPIQWDTQTFSGLAKITVDDHETRSCLWMPYRYRIFFAQELDAMAKASRCFEITGLYGDYNTTKCYSEMRRPRHLIAVFRNTE